MEQLGFFSVADGVPAVLAAVREQLKKEASQIKLAAGVPRSTVSTWPSSFDFDFNKKMNRALVFELATARWITHHEDALFLGPPGTGKSHVAQAVGFAVIQQGHRVLYREAHALVEDLADAQLAGTRKDYLTLVSTVPLLIIDDLGMRKLPHTAGEDLLQIVIRRYERASTLLTSNRPVDDWGNLWRHRGRQRDARPVAPPRARAHLRSAELAHAAPQRPERGPERSTPA